MPYPPGDDLRSWGLPWTVQEIRALQDSANHDATLRFYTELFYPDRLLYAVPVSAAYVSAVGYLPAAFDYLLAHPDTELFHALIHFATQHAAPLAADQMLLATRDRIMDVLHGLTHRFDRHDRDSGEPVIPGQAESGDSFLGEEEQVVFDGLYQMSRDRVHDDLAETFKRQLAAHGDDPVKAAWFLAFAVYLVESWWPPLEDASLARSNALFSEPDRLQQALAVLQRHWHVGQVRSNYWDDVLLTLNLV
jgi:hypothetical protein